METKNIKTLASAILFTLGTSFAMQANAIPSFTFTQYGGFEDGGQAVDFYNQVSGSGSLIPSVNVWEDIGWTTDLDQADQSSLNLSTDTGPSALPEDTWTRISTLTHNNIVIPTSFSWGNMDITARFRITDSDGGAAVVLDDENTVTIDFTETLNYGNPVNCPGPNPLGSGCDDYFTFTASGLDPVFFTSNDGTNFAAYFRLANFVNSAPIGNSVYTAERTSSSMDVEVLVARIPEPATLALLGIGLLGAGFASRRRK